VVAASVIRSDTSLAFYEGPDSGGFTVATTLLGSVKIPGTGGPGEGLAPVVRVALVSDSPPAGDGGVAFVNPLVGATYALRPASAFRLGFFLGVTAPIGMGGGDEPAAEALNARTKGVLARSAMDNALFAVNDLGVIPGVGFAYVDHGFTAQLEATLIQLWRVRGSAAQPDSSKTNLTTGLHLGYFILPALSVGADLRYQRWLAAPKAVDADPTNTLKDTLSFAAGPRAHFKAGSVWFRPGVAYARGLDKPMAASPPNYHVVQIDLPIVF
jgi:hypothetical protein